MKEDLHFSIPSNMQYPLANISSKMTNSLKQSEVQGYLTFYLKLEKH